MDLDTIIAQYLERIEAGEVPDRAKLLAAHPNFADQLKTFFADLDQFDREGGNLRLSRDPNRTMSRQHTNGASASSTSPNGKPLIRYIGDFELLEELAHGGMGIVYKARQITLNRIVALKMTLKGTFATAEDQLRFKAEAEAAATLDHPHIVPIYEIGTHDGQPYFAMRYLEGGDLGDLPRSSLRDEVLRLASITDAVHHAHQRGILHRDLKPGNILLDCTQQPHVTDFGLAKRLDTERSMTETGKVLGTPRYMAPEQAMGKKGLTVTADIYSLGVILYERLSGQTPFQANTVLELLRQVRETPPPRLSTINKALDRDLETIVLKCLEKEPTLRYATATDLHDELHRWLEGRPILARPVSQWEHAWRWAKRNPMVAGLSASVAALLLTVTIISLVLSSWALGEKDRANEQTTLALTAREKAEKHLVDSLLRPLGYQTETDKFDPAELKALQELADFDEDRIKLLFLNEMLQIPDGAGRFLRKTEATLQAVIGASPKRRVAAMELAQARLRQPSLDPQVKAAACNILLVLGSTTVPCLEEVLIETAERGEIQHLALNEFLANLPSEQCSAYCRMFLKIMQEEKNSDLVSHACSGLVVCLSRLESSTSQTLLTEVARASVLLLQKEKDIRVLPISGVALVACVNRLEENSGQSLLAEGARACVDLLQKEKEYWVLSGASAALVTCVNRLEGSSGQGLLVEGARACVTHLQTGNNGALLKEVSAALVACVSRLERDSCQRLLAEGARVCIMRLQKEKNFWVLGEASAALVACVSRLEANNNQILLAEGARACVTLLKKEKDTYVLHAASAALVACVNRFDGRSGQSLRLEVARASIDLLHKEKEYWVLRGASAALVACVSPLEGSSGQDLLAEVTRNCVALMKAKKNIHLIQEISKSQVLSVNKLDSRSGQDLLAEGTRACVAYLQQENDTYVLHAASAALVTCVNRLEASRNSQALLAEGARACIDLLQKEKDTQALEGASAALVACVSRLQGSHQTTLGLQGCHLLTAILLRETDGKVLSSVASGLSSLFNILHGKVPATTLTSLLHALHQQAIWESTSDGCLICTRPQLVIWTRESALHQTVIAERLMHLINLMMLKGKFAVDNLDADYSNRCISNRLIIDLLGLVQDRHTVAQLLKHPAAHGLLRGAILWRLEELCFPPTPFDEHSNDAGQHCTLLALALQPFDNTSLGVVPALTTAVAAFDRYTHRRFGTTWDAVEWMQKNDPTFDWETPHKKYTPPVPPKDFKPRTIQIGGL